jgi:uncharacterized protein
MSKPFVGRHRELRVLEDAARAPTSALIPIYGRRRIGKSELILRFLDEHPGIYYLGKQAPAELQIREFLTVAARVLDQPLLAQIQPAGWKQAFETVLDTWSGPGKLVLALDEFQWLCAASPELPSVLQELWDRRLRDRDEAVLILCGSYIGFMEREVLGKRSPLFGRRTAQIPLQPFGYAEARRFHPDYSVTDAARTYFVCGGVPLYLQAFDPARSVEQNIQATLLDEYAPLYREPDFLLREELRELRTYHAILSTLASGSLPARDIATRTGIDARHLHYYLNQLQELRYIRRRYPLTGRRPAARHVRFVLDDPLLRFWFRFVFPHTSFLAQMGAARCFEQRIRPELDAYWGSCFEALCREALPALYEREGVSAAFEVGEYWDKAVQIDLVGLRDDGWIDLGECKWGAVPSHPALEAEIQRKVERYPNPRNATIGRRLFVRDERTVPAPSGEGIRWHHLAELYGEAEPG